MAVVPLSATSLNHKTAVTIAASPGAAANVPDGNTIPNGGTTILTINNTDASPRWVDIYPSVQVDGDLAATARRFTIPANTIRRVPLGPVNIYGTAVLVKAETVAVRLLAESL